MTALARLVIGMLAIGMVLGFTAGWSFRVFTADHRYIRALAERHEAVTNYYLNQADRQIQTNKERNNK